MSEHVERLVEQVDAASGILHRRRTLLGGIAAGAGIALGVGVIAGATGVFNPFIRWAVRSDGPYTQLNWDDVPIAEKVQWEHFNGDPDAGPLPNSWKTIGLLATQSKALDEQRRETGGQHAIAFRTSDKTMQVGTLSEGRPFFTSKHGETERYVIGARVGGGDLDATLGLWLPDQQAFVAPTAGVERIGRIGLDQLQATWPGVTYA